MVDGTRLKNLSNKLNDLTLSLLLLHRIHSSDINSSPRHFLKLDVPRFDGTDPLGWIFKITQFFEYHNTREEERITDASFYLDDAFLAWFQWMYRNGQIHSWQHLLQALETRFAPKTFKDPRGKLFKLVQTTTVSDFLIEFEAIANPVVGLPPSFLLSCFISGLKPEIRHEVVTGRKTLGSHPCFKGKIDVSLATPTFTRTNTSPLQPQPAKPLPPLLPSPTQKTQMADRREKGLCFNCDKKYSRSHRCPARILLFIVEETDPIGDVALNLRQIGPHQINVLVDGGITHNFVQRKVAQLLGLAYSPSPPLKVLVGSGEELSYVILGAQWLKQLGSILMDYQTLTMKFVFKDSIIELRGYSGLKPSPISIHQLKWVVRTDPSTHFFSLSVRPSHLPDSSPSHPNPQVQHLLHNYSTLFSEPSHIPPHDLLTMPFPYFLTLNRSMCDPINTLMLINLKLSVRFRRCWNLAGFSQATKKDDSWHMCVDYRALNAITVKDRFPLPTVDELLDELSSARCFSKLDLTFGFHQIRLQPDDVHKTAFRTHDGHYEYRVMSFGLCNAAATFQSTMNESFRPLLRHIVANGGVSPDPAKIQAMVQWPTPQYVKGLRGFLGLTGFYRKFVQSYAAIALPLTNLLKKGNFQWSLAAQSAFEALKSAMTSTSVLALPEFSKPFYIQTDASGLAMGAIMLQDNHQIAFYRKATLFTLTTPQFVFLRDLKASLLTDPDFI
ncbi:hypothetical protein V8G54_003189 [Vigna mungo]|uniref:Retrovirus-related Pol polyprotein from transposon 17.6 n=1 Tax=Vigna mungo TaxID=3915 RepID=A0AAQ3PA15_VIGMU